MCRSIVCNKAGSVDYCFSCEHGKPHKCPPKTSYKKCQEEGSCFLDGRPESEISVQCVPIGEGYTTLEEEYGSSKFLNAEQANNRVGRFKKRHKKMKMSELKEHIMELIADAASKGMFGVHVHTGAAGKKQQTTLYRFLEKHGYSVEVYNDMGSVFAIISW